MKDKEKRMKKFPFHTPKSDPTSPAGTTHVDTPPPLDFTRLQSGTSQIQKLYKTATPPLTPTTLSVDAAESKAKVNRSGSSGSEKKISGVSARSVDDSVLHCGSGSPLVSVHPGGPSMSFSHSPTPKTSGAFQPPKNKFKMAHESFRIRMFQEQFGFEPVSQQEPNSNEVFMTKKRTADSKFSEFKGGDLNKYTSRSYTIQNGNEVFGAS
uniref:Uncharacterized protein n=1 Tax=Acrobeloides nanus TaxID=290746 RepID=A0A914E042_9BILA